MNNHQLITILIIEDDIEIQYMEKELLSSHGYKTFSAYSGTEAMLLLEKQEFDIILLDLMLPGLTGEEVLEQLRKVSNVPIICVSAKDDVKVRVELIKKGADDYLVKPFNNEELLARIEALLRRNYNYQHLNLEELHFKDITLNQSTYEVKIMEERITLTKREFAILELLMSNPNKVFTKNNIFESVWNDMYLAEDNAVSVHISNLRNKLGKVNPEGKYIETVWGIGFKMCAD